MCAGSRCRYRFSSEAVVGPYRARMRPSAHPCEATENASLPPCADIAPPDGLRSLFHEARGKAKVRYRSDSNPMLSACRSDVEGGSRSAEIRLSSLIEQNCLRPSRPFILRQAQDEGHCGKQGKPLALSLSKGEGSAVLARTGTNPGARRRRDNARSRRRAGRCRCASARWSRRRCADSSRRCRRRNNSCLRHPGSAGTGAALP